MSIPLEALMNKVLFKAIMENILCISGTLNSMTWCFALSVTHHTESNLTWLFLFSQCQTTHVSMEGDFKITQENAMEIREVWSTGKRVVHKPVLKNWHTLGIQGSCSSHDYHDYHLIPLKRSEFLRLSAPPSVPSHFCQEHNGAWRS